MKQYTIRTVNNDRYDINECDLLDQTDETQEMILGSENWIVFPVKGRTTQINTRNIVSITVEEVEE